MLGDLVAASGGAPAVKYLHLGGDEVVYGCWRNDSTITSWMAQNNIADFDGLMAYFVARADGVARGLGVTPVHWEEVFLAGVPVAADTLFTVWTNSTRVAQVTQAGYHVVAMPSDFWFDGFMMMGG